MPPQDREEYEEEVQSQSDATDLLLDDYSDILV